MDHSRTYILSFLLFTINLLANPLEKCTRKTQTCPLKRDLWYRRAKEFPCFAEGLNYTCMKAFGDILVEACINGYEIRAFTGRCPYIFACDGNEPVLHNQGNWPLCPEDKTGCPPGNHPAYTVYHMYKYPACIVTNVTELQSTTLLESQPYTLSSGKNSYSTTASTSIDIPGHNIHIIVIVIVSIVFVTIVVGIFVLRRKRRFMNKRLYYEEEQSNPLQNIDENRRLHEEEPLNPIHNIVETRNAEICAVRPFVDEGNRYFYRLKETLIQICKRVTDKIPVSPLQHYGKLPIDLLYSKVVIQTDPKYDELGHQFSASSNLQKGQKITVEGPSDIFCKNGEPASRIFMIGDAAHGKTTYCLWFLYNWYNAHHDGRTEREQDIWEKALGQFDLVFLIRLRGVQKSRVTVTDMICKDILDMDDDQYLEWVQNALKTGKYRSLIIIDGLDEWRPDQIVKEDPRYKGMPIIGSITNCVIFITMRRWKFDSVAEEVNSDDRVVEILGLDNNGIQEVTKNVLVNRYGLDFKKPADKQKYDVIIKKSKQQTLTSIMKIPLLAVLCVQIWYKGEEIGNSLTRFYIQMVDMLIERARETHELESAHETTMKTGCSQNDEISVCKGISKQNQFSKYLSLLCKLGKLAYEGLISGKYQFELTADTVTEELGLAKSELEFSLNVGLLSREEADSTMTKKVKICFFHKSLQEFLGAVYITENEYLFQAFCDHLYSVENKEEYTNVLIFLSGLNPMLGSSISQHIVNVANGNTEICKYRTFSDVIIYRNITLELLYELQTSCYREITYSQTSTDNTQQVVPYHVSDVYVHDGSDIETIRITADILTHHHADITSLLLDDVPTDGENGVPDSLLTQYLDHTVSLQSLWIDVSNTDRTLYKISDRFSSLTALVLYHITLTLDAISTLHMALQSNTVIQTLGLVYIKCQVNKDQRRKPASLSDLIQILPDLPRLSTLHISVYNRDDKPVFGDVLSRLSHLHGIRYYKTHPHDAEYDCGVVQTLCTWSGLRWLLLYGVSLGDSRPQLSHDMLHMETVVLYEVNMSSSGWTSFILSVLNIKHKLDVRLHNVDIDKESMTMVRQSPDLNITRDEVVDDGRQQFVFTRLWPPSGQSNK